MDENFYSCEKIMINQINYDQQKKIMKNSLKFRENHLKFYRKTLKI